MTGTQQLDGDVPVSQYEYDESLVLAADLGVTDATVDVVGDTVIVVDGDEQYELSVPGDGGDAEVTINNGVLTVEVSR